MYSRFYGPESRMSWDASATVVIPYLDTPDWLQLVVEMWQRQTQRPFILITETARRSEASEGLLRRLEQLPLTEVARLGTGMLQHSSDAICFAMDYAFSRCPTEYLIATHVDMLPKHRDVVKFMLSQCNAKSPVVGWEMSPRGKGPRGTIEGTTSNGFPGHVCTIFHMPTMDRIGAGWSLRRSRHCYGTLRGSDPEIQGWPDTETCIGLILEQNGIRPRYLGRETNDENQETEHWIHARSRTALGMTPRHQEAFQIGTRILAGWREEDGDDKCPIRLSDEYLQLTESELVATCAYRETISEEKAHCLLASALIKLDKSRCVVEKNTCAECRKRSYPELFTLNLVLSKVAYLSTLGLPGNEAVEAKHLREKYERQIFEEFIGPPKPALGEPPESPA